jgi:CheY-like chemotaxis protein
MRVVIVDDEWFGLDVTYRLLTQIRMDLEVVAFFQDAEEALEKIPALNPDLIILDVEMPVMNGLEVYEKLKKLNTRFMIITAHGNQYLQSKQWDTNVGILNKPFCKSDMSELMKKMDLV